MKQAQYTTIALRMQEEADKKRRIERCTHGMPLYTETGERNDCDLCPKEPPAPVSKSVAAMYLRSISSECMLEELARRQLVEGYDVSSGRIWTLISGEIRTGPSEELDGLTYGEALALRRLNDGWRPSAILFTFRRSLEAKGLIDRGYQLTEAGKMKLKGT